MLVNYVKATKDDLLQFVSLYTMLHASLVFYHRTVKVSWSRHKPHSRA